MHPLIYLTFYSFKNRMHVRLKRLREPRYLLGLIFGFAYFYFVILRTSVRGGRTMLLAAGNPEAVLASIELAGALLLFLFIVSAWLPQGSQRPVLAFTRAEVQFLFPAPFTRRQLIRYRILRSLLGSVIGSAIFTVVLRPGSAIRSWTVLVGMTLLMSIVKLHLMGVSLNRGSLSEHGWLGLKRHWFVVLLSGGAFLVLAGALWNDWATLDALDSPGPILAELRRLFSTGLPAAVLWPFRVLLRLPLASTTAGFFQALPWALAFLVLNYVWVLRSDVAFEEASAEFAEKWGKRRKGRQPSVRPAKASATPFVLAEKGPPETAILWKNLILVGRYLSLKTLLVLVPVVVFVGIPFARFGTAGLSNAIWAMSSVLLFMLLFIGPLVATNDLRQDLGNLAMLKTWPIRGAALVRGEILAPAAILTAAYWLLSLVIFIFKPNRGITDSFILAGALLAPGIILAQLLMQNAIAVMFPSWIRIGVNQPKGIDVMGQRMIMVLGMMLVLLVALLPAAILGGLAGFAGYTLTKRMHIVIPAAIAAAGLLGECYFASEALGRLLDRTDISAIDVAEQ